MDLDPPIPKYSTSDPLSFAHESARKRWPAILTGAIDDVHRSISDLPSDQSEKISEGKDIVSKLASLKYELQHNRKLEPLVDDGERDFEIYNEELKQRGLGSGGEVKWHDVEWLFSECYLYRRINTLFSTSRYWKSYDCFGRQKLSTFQSSRNAVVELAGRYREIIEQVRREGEVVGDENGGKVEEAERVLFTEMMEVCLWGNATDLSLLTNLSYEDIQKLQGSKAREGREKSILSNNLPEAFEVLRKGKHEGGGVNGRVDIVLDNAGFELFVDLVLGGYLIQTGLASEVVLHPKSIPWFVSDVVPKDFAELLDVMQDPKTFYEKSDDVGDRVPEPLSSQEEADIKFLFQHWSELHQDGKLILRPNRFWTHPGSFWRMPSTAKEVVEDLKESQLVIFKGDLNYRKLTGDVSIPTMSQKEMTDNHRPSGIQPPLSNKRSDLWAKVVESAS